MGGGEVDAAFAQAVEDGLKLAKRVYAGKDPRHAPPSRAEPMSRGHHGSALLPSAPMVYAVVRDPGVVDNPDIPSYQPHVHGRCDPPALVPLQMKEVELDVDCYLDAAVVAVRGRWRLHCVMASRSCDCRFVLPMADQGSILGVEVDVDRSSYATQVIPACERQNIEKYATDEDGGFLKPQLFFLTIPQVRGGSDISLKVCWSQKLFYKSGHFSINMPFSFPEYVTPFAKMISKREKIQLNIISGTGKEVLLQRTSHALKEKTRLGGKLAFSYEAEVENWSRKDFHFSYSVYSSDIFGGVLLQAPSMHDLDQRDMFCLYLFPGSNQNGKVFRMEAVFIVDISASMQGKPLENVKSAVSAALLELTSADYFNIIAFSEEMYFFSSLLEKATVDMVEKATQWMSENFVAEGGTNIMQPLNEAMSLLSNGQDSLPQIFLITDGSVEDERDICSTMRTHVANRGSMPPRISTFGIGSYCNHYFLQVLASMSRGHYDEAYDPDSIDARMQRWIRKASSSVVANITVDSFDHLDAFEVYPFPIPDLSVEGPVIMSGRCEGKFPDSLKAKGVLADMSNIVIDLNVQNVKDIPLEKVIGRQQIDLLTAQAWLSESKQLEEKVIELSIQSGIASEYTHMVLTHSEEGKQDIVKQTKKTSLPKHEEPLKNQKNVIVLAQGVTLGFGNIIATLENLPAGFGQPKQPENLAVYTKAVSCCSTLCDCCCCMCIIRTCDHINDQGVIVITQLCTALSCLACFECCSNLCCDGSN